MFSKSRKSTRFDSNNVVKNLFEWAMNPVMDPRFAKKGVGGNMPGVYVPP